MEKTNRVLSIDELTMGELQEAAGAPVIIALLYRRGLWVASVQTKPAAHRETAVEVEWSNEDLGTAVEQAVVEFLGRAHALRIAGDAARA